MASYNGEIDTYTLRIKTPNQPTNYNRVIFSRGSFGLAFLYFVPVGNALGTNRKRAGRNVFDVYFWMDTWEPTVDMLRNEKPVYFGYSDTTGRGSISTAAEPVGEEEEDSP